MTGCSLETSSKPNRSKANGFILRKNCGRHHSLEDATSLGHLHLKVLYCIESYNCVRLASNYTWRIFFLRLLNVVATEMNSYLLNAVSMLMYMLVVFMQR